MVHPGAWHVLCHSIAYRPIGENLDRDYPSGAKPAGPRFVQSNPHQEATHEKDGIDSNGIICRVGLCPAASVCAAAVRSTRSGMVLSVLEDGRGLRYDGPWKGAGYGTGSAAERWKAPY